MTRFAIFSVCRCPGTPLPDQGPSRADTMAQIASVARCRPVGDFSPAGITPTGPTYGLTVEQVGKTVPIAIVLAGAGQPFRDWSHWSAVSELSSDELSERSVRARLSGSRLLREVSLRTLGASAAEVAYSTTWEMASPHLLWSRPRGPQTTDQCAGAWSASSDHPDAGGIPPTRRRWPRCRRVPDDTV